MLMYAYQTRETSGTVGCAGQGTRNHKSVRREKCLRGPVINYEVTVPAFGRLSANTLPNYLYHLPGLSSSVEISAPLCETEAVTFMKMINSNMKTPNQSQHIR